MLRCKIFGLTWFQVLQISFKKSFIFPKNLSKWKIFERFFKYWNTTKQVEQKTVNVWEYCSGEEIMFVANSNHQTDATDCVLVCQLDFRKNLSSSRKIFHGCKKNLSLWKIFERFFAKPSWWTNTKSIPSIWLSAATGNTFFLPE